MKAIIIIIIFLVSAIGLQAQTTYDRKQDRRIDTLSFAMAKLLALSQWQDEKIKSLQDSLKIFQNSIVKSNTLNFIYPVYGKATEIPNSYVVGVDTSYFKR